MNSHQMMMMMNQNSMRLMSSDNSSGKFMKSTLTALDNEELKFSSFLKDEKTYTIEQPRKPLIDAEKFVPKPEV